MYRFLFLTRDNFGFITYRYTCDAFAALENGHTLRGSNEPQFELCFGGQKQFCKSHYTDLGKCSFVVLPISPPQSCSVICVAGRDCQRKEKRKGKKNQKKTLPHQKRPVSVLVMCPPGIRGSKGQREFRGRPVNMPGGELCFLPVSSCSIFRKTRRTAFLVFLLCRNENAETLGGKKKST